MQTKPASYIDLVNLEHEIIKYWFDNQIIQKYLAKNKISKKKFSFLDGPITANNPMGVHHAWGRTYKDLWQRFYNMQGYSGRFQNGFDEQGLWVEVEVEKELGLRSKKDIENLINGNKYSSIAKFVNLCKERVKKYSTIQAEQSRRLGYFMDWDNSYHTSSEQNNYAIWNFLKICHQNGYLYKGRDSVPWCPRCGTAISQHEILTEEYKELTHDAIFFLLPIVEWENYYLKVWTTTPWTIPGNIAVAVNPTFQYGLYYEDGRGKIEIKNKGKTYKKIIKGKELIGLHYTGPFDDLEAVKRAKAENPKTFHSIIPAKDLVTEEEGTGLVHIAPGAGEEDFKLAKEFNLQVIELIDESAAYLDGFDYLSGKNAKENPQIIIDYLTKKSHKLIFFDRTERYTHRYPTCWRCKTELVWRVVDEWYIAMDRKPKNGKSKKTLRLNMIEVAKSINWIPKFGLERELDWLKNMHDWLISKKRYWGLALPIWECHKCGNFEVIGSKDELKKKTVSGWNKFAGNSPHRPWIDLIKVKCFNCGETISRIPDVGNPWLDAGIVPFSTLPTDWFPADFITESFPGQFKNWFYSLIAMSTVLKGTNPFKTVLGFATLLDENGQEMHKSKGNSIEFNEAADRIGVDVMRWMYVNQNPASDMLFGFSKADDIKRRFYLILWNVYLFFTTYSELDGWQFKNYKEEKEIGTLNVLDRWISSRLNSLIKKVVKSLLVYNAQAASQAIEDFVVNDLSTWYIRRNRDRVGPSVPNSTDKDAFYTTTYFVLINLCKLLAPFMPFVSEKIYTDITRELSVHLTDYPQVDESSINEPFENEMTIAREIVAAAHAERKSNSIKVRQPLARLSYRLDQKLNPEIEKVIAEELNVKQVLQDKKQNKLAVFDTKITTELKEEGEARELVRQIQELRKQAGCNLNQEITISAPYWPENFEKYILNQTLGRKIVKAKTLKVNL